MNRHLYGHVPLWVLYTYNKNLFPFLRSKKFYISANFEFRAKNFLMFYTQADRAIKDKSIDILKS